MYKTLLAHIHVDFPKFSIGSKVLDKETRRPAVVIAANFFGQVRASMTSPAAATKFECEGFGWHYAVQYTDTDQVLTVGRYGATLEKLTEDD